METPSKANPEPTPADAEAHIRSTQQILEALQEKIGEHPEIGEHQTYPTGIMLANGLPSLR